MRKIDELRGTIDEVRGKIKEKEENLRCMVDLHSEKPERCEVNDVYL